MGIRVRAKVVKNKVAPPFRQAEFDLIYGEGISKEGCILDMAVECKVAKKSGAWYTYGEQRLGQGREAAKLTLKENPELRDELETKVREAYDIPIVAPAPTEGGKRRSQAGEEEVSGFFFRQDRRSLRRVSRKLRVTFARLATTTIVMLRLTRLLSQMMRQQRLIRFASIRVVEMRGLHFVRDRACLDQFGDYDSGHSKGQGSKRGESFEKPKDESSAYQRILRIVGTREQSSAKVRDKLLRAGFEPDVARTGS